MARITAYFCRFRVVEFLHPLLVGARARVGIGLPELIVAVTVLGAGVLGVAALGSGAAKLARIASVRSAQALAAGGTLEDAPVVTRVPVEVTVDTAGVAPGLIEIRVTVGGSRSAGNRVWVTRRLSPGW
jgi:hypothetical protein